MTNSVVDLRSDTVTRPSAGMRAALAAAEVGDDVLGDDPTVNRLQERAAELLGKPAALFVPSGTMANQLAIGAVATAGDEIIADATTHSYNFEAGAAAALWGCSFYILHSPRGIFSAADVASAVRPPEHYFPRSRMVIIENTNNRGGGSIWPLKSVAEVSAVARRHGLHLHLDGARLLNACVATGHQPTDYTQYADSVSLCFSKGLGAPAGSVIAGSAELITRARRLRRMLGGAMRQAGILAAAALYALNHNIERLAEDHQNARRLAAGLADIPGIVIDPRQVETNIVIFELSAQMPDAREFVSLLREHGVWMLPIGPRRVRAVTHLDVSRDGIEQAIAACRQVCRTLAQSRKNA